ncbi:MAG TPA: sugar ABC transporter substrate-binding protein [Gaiellaceae bacterium]|nr:sugar ABC transporter substrate-binding protein [Gaiellaceae bacterium]
MTKRVCATVAAVAVLVAIALATSGAGAAPKAPKTFTIGISHYALVIPFYRAMQTGFQAGAKRYGVKLVTTDSGFDPSKQVSNIQSLIARKVDAIVVSPGDASALIPAYKAAAAAKIPVFSIANHLAPAGRKYETSFYGRPWDQVSALRTERLARLMKGKGNVIVIRGPSGIAFVQEDKAGFERVMKKNPGIKVVFAQNAKDLSVGEGLRLAQDALTANPKIDGVWVENDDLAAGVARALESRGLAGKVPVVSMDGTAQGFQLISKGILTLTVALPTYSWGADQIRIAAGLVKTKKAVPKYVPSQLIFATKANVGSLLAQCKSTPAQVWCGK